MSLERDIEFYHEKDMENFHALEAIEREQKVLQNREDLSDLINFIAPAAGMSCDEMTKDWLIKILDNF